MGIIGNERRSLLFIHIETITHCLFTVIVALEELAAAFIACATAFGRIKQEVIPLPAETACTATGNPAEQFFLVNGDGYDMLDGLAHAGQRSFQSIRLANGPGETVENETAGAIRLGQPFLNYAYHYLIRNK